MYVSGQVSLFSLAIPCNLPELQEEKDVMWIYEKLLVIYLHTYIHTYLHAYVNTYKHTNIHINTFAMV